MSESSAEGEINNNTESLHHSSTSFTNDAPYTKHIKFEPELDLDLDLGTSSQNSSSSSQRQTIDPSSTNRSRNPTGACERYSPAEDEIITSRAKGKQRESSRGAISFPLVIEDGSEGGQEEFETGEIAILESELPDHHHTPGKKSMKLGNNRQQVLLLNYDLG